MSDQASNTIEQLLFELDNLRYGYVLLIGVILITVALVLTLVNPADTDPTAGAKLLNFLEAALLNTGCDLVVAWMIFAFIDRSQRKRTRMARRATTPTTIDPFPAELEGSLSDLAPPPGVRGLSDERDSYER